jgi:predicted ATP-grasp superfamily ATP-dependent carboligase
LLAPPDSIAAKSRYVSTVSYLAAHASPLEFLAELTKMIDAVTPVLLVPCDEMAVRLLIMLAVDPPPGFDQALQTRLAELVVASLGDPEFYAVSIDKTRLPAAAEALGIRVPAYAIATGVEDALRHAATISYPVVIKRRFGFAGQGVAIAATPDALASAAQQLLRPDQLDLGEWRSPALLVQAFIAGPYHSQALVAERGRSVGELRLGTLCRHRSRQRPTEVATASPGRMQRSIPPAPARRSFGMGGFFNVQFVIDARNGNAHLLEINRRIVTHTHLGEWVGKDLASALFKGREGSPSPASPEGEADADRLVAVFPREWLRDPCSHHLVESPVDVPWDDPELFAAMVAMRHEQ